jgi:hypothetical protein
MASTQPKTNGACGAKPTIPNQPIKRKKRRKRSRNAHVKPKTRIEMMIADLNLSGLTAKDAKKMGCDTVSGAKAKQLFKLSKVNLPEGYLIPYFDADGDQIEGAFRWRALAEYTQRNRRTGKQEPGPKYRQPAGTKPWLYQSPLVDWSDVEGPIIFTEGEKKAASACKRGIPTIGLGGVWNWKIPKSDDALLPGFDEVLLEDSDVEICFDSDVEQNSNVRLALIRFAKALGASGRSVKVIYLPAGPNGEKIGLDDFLMAAGKSPNGKFSAKLARRAFQKLSRHEPPEAESLTSRCAADIKPKSSLPIWENVINRKKVTLLAGDPGLGKSLLAVDAAARTTTGSDWPGGVRAVLPPSNVVIISGEDDADDTIVPRLIAAGADLTRVEIIDDVVESNDGTLYALSIDAHIQDIHKIMVRLGAKLLIIDPIAVFMGERDSHKDAAVRAVLNKLRRLAADSEYAVLIITHFNKPGQNTTAAINRVMGSLGFVAAARCALAFLRDPTDPDQRLMLPIKCNLGPDQNGFQCHIAVDSTQNIHPAPPYLVWEDSTLECRRVDDVMATASPRA